jgi:hypothetical protein
LLVKWVVKFLLIYFSPFSWCTCNHGANFVLFVINLLKHEKTHENFFLNSLQPFEALNQRERERESGGRNNEGHHPWGGKQNFLSLKVCRIRPLALLLRAMKVKILEWLEAAASDTRGRGILYFLN